MLSYLLYVERSTAARDSVKKSANGNMYEVALAETREMFASYVDGAPEGIVGIVSTRTLGCTARTALNSSFAARGYGREACTFATVHPDAAADDSALDPQALFLLVEGLDPLALVVTDAHAAALLGQAYRTTIPLAALSRLFGRDLVAFDAFEELLDSTQDKQAAWALLKKLPKFGE